MTEAQHQQCVLKWSQQPHIRAQWPELSLLFHIPNGGTRDAVEGRHLKQQGVKPGVPDLCQIGRASWRERVYREV